MPMQWPCKICSHCATASASCFLETKKASIAASISSTAKTPPLSSKASMVLNFFTTTETPPLLSMQLYASEARKHHSSMLLHQCIPDRCGHFLDLLINFYEVSLAKANNGRFVFLCFKISNGPKNPACDCTSKSFHAAHSTPLRAFLSDMARITRSIHGHFWASAVGPWPSWFGKTQDPRLN